MRALRILALGISLAISAPAHCTPLSANSAAAAGAQPLSEFDLLQSDPPMAMSPDEVFTSISAPILGRQPGRSSANTAADAFDFGSDLTSGLPPGGTLRDVIRSVVNVQRNGGSAPASPVRGAARPPRNDDPALDLGFATSDSMRDMLTSILHLQVNERGQASFSIMGMGDFSVFVSADKSEVALTVGDDVLITGRRPTMTPSGTAAGGAGGAAHGEPGWSLGSTPGGGTPGSGTGSTESVLKQAVELMLEIAGHPLSFLLYALIGAYALLWMALNTRRARHQPSLASYRDYQPQQRAAVPSDIPRTPRKRVRVRRRRHRSRPSTQHE